MLRLVLLLLSGASSSGVGGWPGLAVADWQYILLASDHLVAVVIILLLDDDD